MNSIRFRCFLSKIVFPINNQLSRHNFVCKSTSEWTQSWLKNHMEKTQHNQLPRRKFSVKSFVRSSLSKSGRMWLGATLWKLLRDITSDTSTSKPCPWDSELLSSQKLVNNVCPLDYLLWCKFSYGFPKHWAFWVSAWGLCVFSWRE